MSPLTVPPTVCWSVTHVTLTPVTFPPASVPLSLVTLQTWLGVVGWLTTVTA